MAIVCCEKCGAPRGKIHNYANSVRPIGYPNPSVLCYKKGCCNCGLVWLNEVDQANYNAGEREIVIWGQSVKIRVV